MRATSSTCCLSTFDTYARPSSVICVAACCSMLQYVVLCCSVLQRVGATTHTRTRILRLSSLLTIHICIHILHTATRASLACDFSLQFIFLFISIPPAPMNHVKYLRAGPAKMPFQTWYTVNTNHFRLTDFCQAEIKDTTVLSNKPSTA